MRAGAHKNLITESLIHVEVKHNPYGRQVAATSSPYLDPDIMISLFRKIPRFEVVSIKGTATIYLTAEFLIA